MAKLLSANEKRRRRRRNLMGFSEMEIEAAAWQLIQLRKGDDEIHQNTGVTAINNQRQDDQVNTDEEEDDDYYKPSEEVLSTGIDDDDDDDEEKERQLIKWRKRKFHTVDYIYCLTKPVPVVASNAKMKKKKKKKRFV